MEREPEHPAAPAQAEAPAQARGAAAMDLLALKGRCFAEQALPPGSAADAKGEGVGGMELDECGDEVVGVNKDGGLDEMELDECGDMHKVDEVVGVNEDGGLDEMQWAATGEQKRVREMREDNAEKCRMASTQLQRAHEAAMTDGTTLSIGGSDGLDLDKWNVEVNAPAYALVLPLTRALLHSAHDLLAAAAAKEAKDPSSTSARLLS